MSEFDAKRARSKRPMPMWIDAFRRDTGHLEADEVGAYMNILMCMWSTPSLSLPDDPKRLARAAGVSVRLWNSRMAQSIGCFLTPCQGGVTQTRLAKEAAYVERQVTLQHSRKYGKKKRKPLKDNDTDKTGENPGIDPGKIHPNDPTYIEESKASSIETAEFYQRYLSAHPNPVESALGEDAFFGLVASGENPETIVAAASAYAEKAKTFSSPNFIQQSDNFLGDRGKWRVFVPKPKASDEDVLSFYADVVISKKRTAASTVNAAMAGRLLAAKLVTEHQLSEVGIAI